MYEVDQQDRVYEITGLPQSSVGAPLPVLVADEDSVVVAFFVEREVPGWDGSWVAVITPESDEPWAAVHFIDAYATMFGPPNDEALSGHPLYSRGLRHYGSFGVRNSSWIRRLERMNAVHRRHNPSTFASGLHHFVLSFHDSTFECVARTFRVLRGVGPLANAPEHLYPALRQRVDWPDFVPPPILQEQAAGVPEGVASSWWQRVLRRLAG